MHRPRIARLDVPARAIYSSPAVFKREALAGRGGMTTGTLEVDRSLEAAEMTLTIEQ